MNEFQKILWTLHTYFEYTVPFRLSHRNKSSSCLLTALNKSDLNRWHLFKLSLMAGYRRLGWLYCRKYNYLSSTQRNRIQILSNSKSCSVDALWCHTIVTNSVSFGVRTAEMTLCVEFTNGVSNGGDALYRPVDGERRNAVEPRENTAQTNTPTFCLLQGCTTATDHALQFYFMSSGRILWHVVFADSMDTQRYGSSF
jgi:hypothetical protein